MTKVCPTSPSPPLARLILLICAVTLAGTQTSRANEKGEPDTPEFIDGVTIVDAEGLINKVMDMPELILIDSRIVADRKQGFIENSVSLPDIETSCETLAEAIHSKSTPALFYCNGIKCGRSARAAQIAVNCDYTTLYWYRNGMEEWKERNYPLVQ